LSRRSDPNRCKVGHDLTIEANVIRKAGKTPECRICQAAMSRRYHEHAPIVTECRECGEKKKPNKARLCDRCRWVRATKRAIEDPRGRDLVDLVDRAIALESATPWERAEAKKAREIEDAALRERLRSRVTQDPPE